MSVTAGSESCAIAPATAPEATHRRRVRPVLVIAGKELAELARDARWRLLAGVTLVLAVVAVSLAIVDLNRHERSHQAAEQEDRRIWTSQGAKNPHSAAHFGQYAFKPVGPLAVADPGVDAFAGTAVLLEAHKQNEDRFRPARDGTLTARMGRLTLAFVLQAIVPLMAILLGFSAYSGEREAGTLAQLLSLGVKPRDLLLGKALAFGAVLAVLIGLACGGLALGLACFGHDDPGQPGIGPRLAGLALAYGVYTTGFLALALAVSARAGSSRTAIVGLLAFWLANVFVAPRAASDMARAAVPLPTAQSFRDAIAEAKRAQFGHDPNHPGFVAFRDRVLRHYGVARVEELPVSFRGLSLREDDEAGYRIFDEHFGRLAERIATQDSVRARAGFLFPLLALQPISMGMAGTDNAHHADFVRAAESHRRLIQDAASQDMIDNARNGDHAYEAPPDLWRRIPSFAYTRPGAAWAWKAQAANLAMLALWCGACCGLAWVSALRPSVR